MKKNIIIAITIILIIISILVFMLTRPNKEILSITIDETEYTLKRGKYKYNIPVNMSTTRERITVKLYDNKDSYEILTTEEIFYIDETFQIKYTNQKGKEKIYSFTLVDSLEEGALQFKVEGCIEENQQCDINGDFPVIASLKKNKIVLSINNKDALELEARNFNINSIRFLKDHIAFFHQNTTQDEQINLYILNKEGDVILKLTNIIEPNVPMLNSLKIVDNKFNVSGSLVIGGFSVKIDDEIVDFCKAPKNAAIENVYEIEITNNVPKINKIGTYTVGEFLKTQISDSFNPCAND